MVEYLGICLPYPHKEPLEIRTRAQEDSLCNPPQRKDVIPCDKARQTKTKNTDNQNQRGQGTFDIIFRGGKEEHENIKRQCKS
eukprot:5522011-Pyramimonas_sp.AAC.1